MNIFLFAFVSILWFAMMCVRVKSYLHIIQLEGYKINKFYSWINENKRKIYKRSDIYFLLISFILIILYVLFYRVNGIEILLFLALILLYFISYMHLIFKKKSYKKPLLFTKRAKRLFFIIISLIAIDYFIAIALIELLTKNIFNCFPICVGIMSILYFFSIYYVVLGNFIAVPIENKINNRFYNLAGKKIRSFSRIQTIGITGSYGKTSTKFITATILSEKFKVMNTPESYNTPMGISKVINNELNDTYDIFIAELGATKPGDINEVARLTNPNIGILTSIGSCHLQTFGSINNIMETKYELIEYLKDDGIAIFNYDNPYVKELADKTNKRKLLYAIYNTENTDVYANKISVNEKGSVFTLCVKGMGCIDCETLLLGRHNILNILAGVTASIAVGMNLEEIKLGIAKILPVKHRLQLLDPKTGVLVIDDAFNSNPDGASAALEVLAEFKNRRKIIITPGMIELGNIEKKENEKFGEKISEICDIVILVGKKRTEPIYEGLKRTGFNLENLYVVNSTNESTEVLKSITMQGDIILYENDLPDTYDEN